MLGKCMKYELKAFAKLMLPMLGVFAFTWIIEVVLMNLGFKQGDFVILLLWICFIPMMFLSVIGIPLVCCIFGAKRYNDVFFSKKAYLMRPLPVKGKTLVISIVLTSVIWYLISAAVMILALLVPSFSQDPAQFLMNLGSLLKSLIEDRANWMSVAFSSFLTVLSVELMIMLAVTLASKHSGSRFGISFLYFLLISFVSSLFHGIFLRVFLGALNTDSKDDSLFFTYFDIPTIIFRAVLSVGILIYLLWNADRKADVIQ